MELNSTVKDTWRLSTFGSLIGCLILLFFLNRFHQNVTISTARNAMPDLLVTLSHDFQSPPCVIYPPNPQPEQPSPNIVHPPEPQPEQSSHNVVHPPKPQPLRPSSIVMFPSKPKVSPMNSTINHIEKPVNKTPKKCNIFEGKWVYKAEENPTYNLTTCPFLEEKMSCRNNGRPDFEYEKWRWEASDCNLPMFNGTDMLERLRNKRMIIVGDSLNRNQWESLACLLYTSIPSSRAEVDAQKTRYKFLKAKDYNFTLEFYWSPFLVHLDENHKSGKKVLVLDQLSPNSKNWRGADVMVFNTGHWWTHIGKLRSWDLFQFNGELMEEMPIEVAYQRGVAKWGKWLKTNVNPKKTTVYFRSISPEHKRAKQWCYNSTQPIMDESYQSLYPKSLTNIIEGFINEPTKPKVNYLNITKLSGYRMDAHPSVFRSWQWKIYQDKYKRLIPSYADCSHWCLPGLPDTWNRLLYVSLFLDSSANMSSS